MQPALLYVPNMNDPIVSISRITRVQLTEDTDGNGTLDRDIVDVGVIRRQFPILVLLLQLKARTPSIRSF